MKSCKKCKTEQPEDNFHWRRPGVRRTECKTCKAKYMQSRKASMTESERLAERERARACKRASMYGMPVDDLRVVERVKFCAICYGDAEVIDHCHHTGKVRGVLCHACNQSLGKMHDSPAFLRRAAEYLEDTGEPKLYGH